MNADITTARAILDAARRDYDRIVDRVQSECPHPEQECFESDSTRGHGYGRRPVLVCRACGYAECAWHGRNKIPYYGLLRITLEQADSMRVGKIHDWENTNG